MSGKHIASLLLGAAAGGLMAATPASAATAEETAWFQKTTQALADAIATGDKTVWNRALAPDWIVTTEDGVVQNKTQFLEDLAPLPTGFSGVLKIKELTVNDLGAAAVVHYLLDETEDIYDQHLWTKYLETDTYRKQGDGWEMVASQVTVVPRDMDPVKVDTRGWPKLVGDYRLSEQTKRRYHVVLRDGALYGGNDEKSLALLIPLSPLVFHQKGSIHLMVFVPDASGAVTEVREIHKYNEVVIHRVPKGD